MLPVPTPRAVVAFVGCALALALALATAAPAAALLAMASLLGLASTFALAMPIGRRARAERLEFAWWLAGGAQQSAVVPGAPVRIRCYLRHRGPQSLVLTELEPLVGGGLRPLDAPASALVLRPATRTEFELHFEPAAAGRVVLHGLAVTLRGPLDLFRVPLYFPNPLALRVLPRAAAVMARRVQASGGLPVERSSGLSIRRRGSGTEIHELRDLLPGDPFKSIAWKASARAGRLLVREVEREVQELRWIVVDIGASMRAGPRGARTVDHAIELAAAQARRALEAGNRVGLVTVDARVRSFVPADDRPGHLLRVFDALLDATEIVDEDLTDAPLDDLLAVVGRYVRAQDGIDFRSGAGWQEQALLAHVRPTAEADGSRHEVVASSQGSALLRRFCRARDLSLPHRTAPARKAAALADGLERVTRASRVPASVLIVSDLDDVDDLAPVVAALQRASRHGHVCRVVLLDPANLAPPAATPWEETLRAIYAPAEARRIDRQRAALRRAGVDVYALRGGATAVGPGASAAAEGTRGRASWAAPAAPRPAGTT